MPDARTMALARPRCPKRRRLHKGDDVLRTRDGRCPHRLQTRRHAIGPVITVDDEGATEVVWWCPDHNETEPLQIEQGDFR